MVYVQWQTPALTDAEDEERRRLQAEATAASTIASECSPGADIDRTHPDLPFIPSTFRDDAISAAVERLFQTTNGQA